MLTAEITPRRRTKRKVPALRVETKVSTQQANTGGESSEAETKARCATFFYQNKAETNFWNLIDNSTHGFTLEIDQSCPYPLAPFWMLEKKLMAVANRVEASHRAPGERVVTFLLQEWSDKKNSHSNSKYFFVFTYLNGKLVDEKYARILLSVKKNPKPRLEIVVEKPTALVPVSEAIKPVTLKKKEYDPIFKLILEGLRESTVNRFQPVILPENEILLARLQELYGTDYEFKIYLALFKAEIDALLYEKKRFVRVLSEVLSLTTGVQIKERFLETQFELMKNSGKTITTYMMIKLFWDKLSISLNPQNPRFESLKQPEQRQQSLPSL